MKTKTVPDRPLRLPPKADVGRTKSSDDEVIEIARRLYHKSRSIWIDFAFAVFEVQRCEAWKPKGHDSFLAFCRVEFPDSSPSTISKLCQVVAEFGGDLRKVRTADGVRLPSWDTCYELVAAKEKLPGGQFTSLKEMVFSRTILRDDLRARVDSIEMEMRPTVKVDDRERPCIGGATVENTPAPNERRQMTISEDGLANAVWERLQPSEARIRLVTGDLSCIKLEVVTPRSQKFVDAVVDLQTTIEAFLAEHCWDVDDENEDEDEVDDVPEVVTEVRAEREKIDSSGLTEKKPGFRKDLRVKSSDSGPATEGCDR